MSEAEQKKRRSRYAEVLAAAVTRQEFCREDIVAECQSATSRVVASVLKQLSADSVLGLVSAEWPENSAARRYTWLQDPNGFDSQAWIERQLSGGNQVTAAPTEVRPRERLLELGASGLTTSELLAILIRSGRTGESAIQAGQRVAKAYEGKLERLAEPSPGELKAVSAAVSKVAYCQIMAGIELGRRVADAIHERRPQAKINSTQAARQFCLRHFSRLAHDAQQEEFHIVTLDTKLQPIGSHQITIGTLDASLVHPREVFKAAIRDSASSILLVHNHPSGDPTPSRQDHEVTERLKSAGTLLGIQVVDHIVVARGQAVSLAEVD